MKEIKKLKRKCWKCKEIKELNSKNFGKTTRSADRYFKWLCKKCDLKRLVGLEDVNPKKKILEKLGKKCNMCGLESEISGFFDIDHIKPKLKHVYSIKMREINNLQILCPNCHRIKTISDREIYKWGRQKNK